MLDPTEFLRFTSDPSSFGKEIEFLYTTKNQKIFIVDEIQKLPILLDEVHRQIELRKDVRFILVCSNARKLLKSGVNLLGGRASKFLLYPRDRPYAEKDGMVVLPLIHFLEKIWSGDIF